MSEYVYPASQNAKGTNMSADLIKSNDDIEAHLFSKVLQIVGQTDGLLVDIGAGEGRYSQLFGAHAKNIILVEPDQKRLQRAKANVANTIDAELKVVQGTVNDVELAGEQADVILNVHVLQHIHPDSADAILQNSATWLKRGGKLILCFTKKTERDAEFNASWKEGDVAKYGPVTESKFEQLTLEGEEGVLPVHKMDKQAVENRLKELGMSIIFEEDYTPRLLELKQNKLGNHIIDIYKRLNPVLVQNVLKAARYKSFVDTCIVAEK